jgi:quinol monooxygenase YgiN
MDILLVEVSIKPERLADFLTLIKYDAEHSENDEPGCLRFDVLQDNEDENRLHLYEVYRDEAAVEAHRSAPHFTRWREECKDWFATENVRRLATPVYPAPEKWQKRPPAD